MKLKLLILPFILVVAALAIAGCSGDDDDSGDDGDSEPTASAPADNGDEDNGDEDSGDDDSGDDDSGGFGEGGFGSGTGTLTIGDESYEITGIGCVFSAEESGQDSIPFNLSGFGQSSTGARAQLSADVYDPDGLQRMEGEGVSHNISFTDIEDFENPSVDWSTVGAGFGGGTETKLTIDGKHITGVGSFDDGTTADEFESIDGTLEVDCP